MEDPKETAQQERVYQRLFQESFRRLKRQGLEEQAAGALARRVAEEALERVKTPVFATDQEYSEAIGRICRKLSEGMSHYSLTGEMPYLIGGRLDRVTAIAKQVLPPIDGTLIEKARKVSRMERVPAGSALFFMGLALETVGLWYALAVGVVVAVVTEVYSQMQMPVSMRRSAGRLRVPLVLSLAAAGSLIYFGYRWVVGDAPRNLYVIIAAVAVLLIAFVIPGVTLARLVNSRERRWRKELERELLSPE